MDLLLTDQSFEITSVSRSRLNFPCAICLCVKVNVNVNALKIIFEMNVLHLFEIWLWLE